MVVEIANEANVAVALAAAMRPYDPAGLGRINSLAVADNHVLVNEQLACSYEREPNDVRTANGGTDVASLLNDDTEPTAEAVVTCEAGWANAALIFTLVHGSTLRLLLPLDEVPTELPSQRIGSPAAVERGWRAHADAAWRCVLPAGRLAQAFTAARTQLPLAIGESHVDVAPWGPQASEADEAVVLRSLVEMGYAPDVIEVMLARAQTSGGRGDIVWRQRDVTASTLIAAGELVRYGCADAALLAALAEVVADAARWLLAQREADALVSGALAERGLADLALAELALDGAELWLAAAGESRAHRALVDSRHARMAARAVPNGSLGASSQAGTEVADALGASETDGDLRHLTARAARLAQHEPAAAALVVDELLGCASDTFTWPTFSSVTAAERGCGNDLVVAAHFTAAVRRLLVAETQHPQGFKVELARWWPRSWLGAEMDLNGLPIARPVGASSTPAGTTLAGTTLAGTTAVGTTPAGTTSAGRASFAVRWHGERPALLWEIAGAGEQVTVTAPGLDPTFVAHTAAGEALLAPLAPAEP